MTLQQAGAALCLMHRGDAAFRQTGNGFRGRAGDIGDNNTGHSWSTVRGKIDWKASA